MNNAAGQERVILPDYKSLSDFTGTCTPTLRKLVNRRSNPLPAVHLSPRKIVFVASDVIRWMQEEAERQAYGT